MEERESREDRARAPLYPLSLLKIPSARSMIGCENRYRIDALKCDELRSEPQVSDSLIEIPIYGDEKPTARMLAIQDRHLVAQRDDLEFQFDAAPKLTSEPG